jgi:hypothetical protein
MPIGAVDTAGVYCSRIGIESTDFLARQSASGVTYARTKKSWTVFACQGDMNVDAVVGDLTGAGELERLVVLAEIVDLGLVLLHHGDRCLLDGSDESRGVSSGGCAGGDVPGPAGNFAAGSAGSGVPAVGRGGDLTDEIPMAVQIAVPRRTWPPKLDHPPVEVFLWDPTTFELGLDAVEVAPGERARIYSPGRTVVDLIRMRHKLGESVAHVAMRRYLSRRAARIADLMTYAKALDVLGPVRAVVDVLSAS